MNSVYQYLYQPERGKVEEPPPLITDDVQDIYNALPLPAKKECAENVRRYLYQLQSDHKLNEQKESH